MEGGRAAARRRRQQTGREHVLCFDGFSHYAAFEQPRMPSYRCSAGHTTDMVGSGVRLHRGVPSWHSGETLWTQIDRGPAAEGVAPEIPIEDGDDLARVSRVGRLPCSIALE